MQSDLNKMDANVAEMYAARCKKSPKELLDLMKEGAWLTSKEALAWGFVDEITDYEDDTAPVLTEAVVASMNEAGMPIPNLPVTDKTSGFGKFMSALYSFFASNGKQVPVQNGSAHEVNVPKTTQTQNTMNKTFTSICALLALDALAETDGQFSMSKENLQTIEDAIKQKDSDIRAKDEEITALKSQVDALKASPGSSTSHVVDEKNPNSEKSAVEKYVDTINSAREIYDMLP